MPNDEQSEILILGGGPAGTAAAIHLARGGRQVILIERESAPRDRVCGEFLSAEALHFLSSLGIDSISLGGEPIHSVRLASMHHMTEARLPFPAVSLTRRCLDRVLLDAAEKAGTTILRGTTIESLTRTHRGWTATLNTGDTVSAPSAILATGKHDLRGFPRPLGKQNDLVALKMYWRLEPRQTAILQNTVELYLHPFGYTGLQPVQDGLANLTALVRKEHLAELRGWSRLLTELRLSSPHAAERLWGAEPLLERPLALSGIPYGFVRGSALAHTLYAVGDQAAVIPSFTGDGMSIALFTGFAAARAILADQSAGQFQAQIYEHLRSQVARATLLSQALIHPLTKPLVTTAASLWPGTLRLAAMLTRLSATPSSSANRNTLRKT